MGGRNNSRNEGNVKIAKSMTRSNSDNNSLIFKFFFCRRDCNGAKKVKRSRDQICNECSLSWVFMQPLPFSITFLFFHTIIKERKEKKSRNKTKTKTKENKAGTKSRTRTRTRGTEQGGQAKKLKLKQEQGK
jgi:hypothetical protein